GWEWGAGSTTRQRTGRGTRPDNDVDAGNDDFRPTRALTRRTTGRVHTDSWAVRTGCPRQPPAGKRGQRHDAGNDSSDADWLRLLAQIIPVLRQLFNPSFI